MMTDLEDKLGKALEAVMSPPYRECGFRSHDGMPCGECQQCKYTTEASCQATEALREWDIQKQLDTAE